MSTYTIGRVLHEAGASPQKTRSWCPTGTVLRKRKSGTVVVTDPDTTSKKKWIEDAYQFGEAMGLSVWCTDQAGPFQTIPQPGTSWQPEGHPARQPHEYLRNGTAQVMTLFHPADGQVRVKGVRSCPNTVLHGWLKQELTTILATLPTPPVVPGAPGSLRSIWERWQTDLRIKATLSEDLPPLRMLLVLDNLAGHKTPEFVLWLFSMGIMPLDTPLGGSWLNMVESLQRILKRRAWDGQHPSTPEQIMGWFEAVAEHWNQSPTPFDWGGNVPLAVGDRGSDAAWADQVLVYQSR